MDKKTERKIAQAIANGDRGALRAAIDEAIGLSELRQEIEALRQKMGESDTVEAFEERVEAFKRAHPEASWEAALNFVSDEYAEKDAKRRAREEERRAAEAERQLEKLELAASGMSPEAVIELVEREEF